MKKYLLVFFCFTIFVCVAEARDFDVSWVEQVSRYIGGKTDDVPLSFSPNSGEYYSVERSKVGGVFGVGGRNVVKLIHADSRKNVDVALWYMDSWLGGDETRELSDIRTILTSQYGQPDKNGLWIKKGGGFFKTNYEIGIYRDDSDGSACVLVQKQESGFGRRWRELLGAVGVR